MANRLGFISNPLISFAATGYLISRTTSVQSQGEIQPVGVWLDKSSQEYLKYLFPTLKSTDVVNLESQEYKGSRVFEPLYGIKTTCKVLGVASCDNSTAVIVGVSISAGEVNPVGQSLAVIADKPGFELAEKLVELDVIKKGKNWCGMVSHESRNELYEYRTDVDSMKSLKGIICPAEFYQRRDEVCAWTPPNENTEHPNNEPMSDECPLCAFIKAGGCKEAFVPFQQCVKLASELEQQQEKSEEKESQETEQGKAQIKEKPNCLPLFDPVLQCMRETKEKRGYYSGFINDFSHLFKDQ